MRPSQAAFTKPHIRSPQPATRPAAVPSTLKILVAGVDKDARGAVEDTVRLALGGRDPAEAWSVSLVRIGTSWSVSLSGPGDRFRNLSFSAESHRLGEAIRAAISGEAAGPPPAAHSVAAAASAASKPARSRIQDRHECGRCKQAILVSYESEAGEDKERSPVACPHCWAVIQVEIGGWAAAGGDYVAERA